MARKQSVRLYRDLAGREEPEARQVRAPTPRAGPRLVGLVEEPQEPKVGRPPIHDRAMTEAERKRRQRKLAPAKRTIQEILTLIREQMTDDQTGGAFGPGRYMKDAEPGKGLLVTGGYTGGKLSLIDAHQNPGWDGEKSTFSLPNRPAGASPDSETESEPTWSAPRCSASFSDEWNRRQKEIMWERIEDALMFETTICLLCDWSSLSPADTEIYEHLKSHRYVRHLEKALEEIGLGGVAIITEPRCIVCGRSDTEHIRLCELTPEDREFNGRCKLEIFQDAGIQPRRMTENERNHRRAVREVRSLIS
jgi:hypothetical protein